MTTTSTAAVLEQYGAPLALRQLPKPVPQAGEVLVRVMASGLCGTDLHMQDGRVAAVRLPHVPGHETSGVITAIGDDVDRVRVGDCIIVGIDVTCGTCRYCASGLPNLCARLTRFGFEKDGGLQEYMAIPARNALTFNSSKVSFAKAAIIPDAVACMYRAIKVQGQVCVADRVCLLGMGGLGFQGIQIAKLCGAETYCTSRHDEKLDIARSMGADHVINTAAQDLRQAILDSTGGELCDVVVDHIGSRTSVQAALDICRPGGRVVVVGYTDDEYCIDSQTMVLREKQIIGVRGSTIQDLTETIRLVEAGKIDPFVSNSYQLTKVNQALQSLRDGQSMGRTVVVME
ncbi:MAG: zinc-binding dehydrogenase [Propionibacteriaceae bacterium]|nr:zinc-binding dehydrogenase [Propionibacteriaceae bacterium]